MDSFIVTYGEGSVVETVLEYRAELSGVYGDEDRRGIAMAGGGVGSAAEQPEILEGATRTRMVRFRVRFSLQAG